LKTNTTPRRALKFLAPAAAAAAIVLGTSATAGAYPLDPDEGGSSTETTVPAVAGDQGSLPATGGSGTSDTVVIAGVTLLAGAGLVGLGSRRRRSAGT
jgi:LPXTG-motif cell wall-anchored protein